MILEATIMEVQTYYEDTGFFVAWTEAGEQVKGSSNMAPSGEMTFEGEWTQSYKWGRQFNARKSTHKNLTNKEIARNLLCSGFLTGVQVSKGNAIAEELGDRTFEVLDACLKVPVEVLDWKGQRKLASQILLDCWGVGPHVYHQIVRSWEEHREDVTARILSLRAGLSNHQFVQGTTEWGAQEFCRIILEDPFMLTLLHGVNWEKADEIAAMVWPGKVPVPHDSAGRYAAALREMIDRNNRMTGHMAMPFNQAIDEAIKLCKPNQPFWPMIEPNMDALGIYRFDNLVTDKKHYLMEKEAADQLKAIQKGTRNERLDVLRDVNPADFTTLTLSDEQTAAVRIALSENVSIVTGGPGTGKTTAVLSTILKALDAHQVYAQLCAPTGKAVVRMRESTGREAKTLHSYFALFKKKGHRSQLLDNYLIIDEVSMVSADIFHDVLELVQPGQRIVFIGDADQLPPVGPGEPLMQMLDAGIPSVRLNRIYRQGPGSGITKAAHAINRGVWPEAADDITIGRVSPGEMQSKVLAAVDWLHEKGFDYADIQVLTPTNKGPLGQIELNKLLRKKINPHGQEVAGTTFQIGDRVIHTQNNYTLGVMNGEVGNVVAAGPSSSITASIWERPAVLLVEYPMHEEPTGYDKNDLPYLRLAYAITIHKSQGSEFLAVVAVTPKVQPNFALRQLPYTAVTRASKACVLISEAGFLQAYLNNTQKLRRISMLSKFIQQENGQSAKSM